MFDYDNNYYDDGEVSIILIYESQTLSIKKLTIKL